jgi:hypothetical protein
MGAEHDIEARSAFAELVAALEHGGRGNGSGNNGGGSGNDGGGGGDDLGPVSGRMLIGALRQMAAFTETAILSATERTADLLTDTVMKGREASAQQLIATAKELHDNAMALNAAVADRFEAAEKRLAALERALGRGAGDDAGGGP